MRLIDADNAIEVLEILCDKCQDIRPFEDAIGVLQDAPTIDAVPVVRCKDCKWSVKHYDTDRSAPYWSCKNWDGGLWIDADGFCYEAERRTDE